MREEVTGLRRAAIVLLSLGRRRAEGVLRNLPADAARDVREEMRRVGALRAVSLRTRQLVLGQFCAAASPHPPLPEPHASPAASGAMANGPFASLHEAGTDNLLDTLRQEHPQTIALVLAHLPPDRVSEVLARFGQHQRVEIIRRIAGIEQTSSQVIEQVENSLRQRLAAIMGQTIRAGGVSAVAEILNAADERIEDEILTGLEAQSPDLAEQIRRVAAVFESLMHASDEDMQAVIEQLDHDTISLSLRTARQELRRKVMWNLPQQQAQQIEREMAHIEPVAVRDIEQAQQRVAEVVHRLESAGEIELGVQQQRQRDREQQEQQQQMQRRSSARRAWRQQHRKAV